MPIDLLDPWRTRANMPTARYALAAAAAGGKVYALGGAGPTNKNEEYNPDTNSWATKANMPTARYYLAAAEVGGKVYALGGYGPTNTNEEYNAIPTIVSGNVKRTDGTNATNTTVAVVVIESDDAGMIHTMTDTNGTFTLNILAALLPTAKIIATAIPNSGAGGVRWTTPQS